MTNKRFWQHQKALLLKTVYFKRGKLTLSIFEIILPGLLLSILALARVYFRAFNDIPEYNFDDEKWSQCPIGFYGTYLDRILPEDFFTSENAYTKYRLNTVVNKNGAPSISTSPDGLTDDVCTPFGRAIAGKSTRTSFDSSTLSDIIHTMDSGRTKQTARITWGVSYEVDEEPPKPGMVLWLEEIANKYRPVPIYPSGTTCGVTPCSDDAHDVIFKTLFEYHCDSTQNSVNQFNEEDCIEQQILSSALLDGPGSPGMQMIYRPKSTLDKNNDYVAEITHLSIDEKAGTDLEVNIRPNGRNVANIQATSPLASSPITTYGRLQLYQAGSIGGFYGSQYKAFLMDLEPIVNLYAMREGSKAYSMPIAEPNIADFWSLLVSAAWWSQDAYELIEKDRKTTQKTGVPSLPWYYRGGVSLESSQTNFWTAYQDTDLEKRVEYMRLGQSLFVPICLVYNEAARSKDYELKASLKLFYDLYKESMTVTLKSQSEVLNRAIDNDNSIVLTELTDAMIDDFWQELEAKLDEYATATPSGSTEFVPCNGEEMELYSRKLSEIFLTNYWDTSKNSTCNCMNNFCTGTNEYSTPCDAWFDTTFSIHKAYMSTLFQSEVFGELESLAMLETTEVAFPQPAGALSTFDWQFQGQPMTFQFMMLVYLCSTIFLIKLIMTDKEGSVVPYLKVIGISSSEYWFHYYWFCFIYNILFSIIIGLVNLYVLSMPKFGMVFLAFFTSGLYFVGYSVFLASITTRGSDAILITIVLFVFCNAINVYVELFLRFEAAWLKYLLTAFPTFSINWCVRNFMLAEVFTPSEFLYDSRTLFSDAMTLASEVAYPGRDKVKGAYWAILSQPIGGVTAGFFMLYSLLWGVFWALLGHYIMNVWPLDGQPAKKWNFFLRTEFWASRCIGRKDTSAKGVSVDGKSTDRSATDPKSSVKGITSSSSESSSEAVVKIDKVTKSFNNGRKVRSERGRTFKAVDNVSLTVERGEIFGLLGHNGAGKTTLISMIIGKIGIGEGDIYLDGVNIKVNPSLAMAAVGYCPQFDILFSYMTVRQHFEFVARIKGVEDIENEVLKAADVLDLNPKLDAYVSSLSGGQRRRVSAGMAVIGRPSLLIMDEPSTGIDPSTRRSLWKCIRRISAEYNCAIILTTHYMDEADYLSDRIGIMAGGKLMACGSPRFLKESINTGYVLTLCKDQNTNIEQNDQLIEWLLDLLPEMSLRSDVGAEMVFTVPFASIGGLCDLLEDLEDKKDKSSKHVRSFHVGVASIEDVFLKLGAHGESKVEEVTKLNNDIFREYGQQLRPSGIWQNIKGPFVPLLTKKWKISYRNPIVVIVTMFAPALSFVLFGGLLLSIDSPTATVDLSADYYRNVAPLIDFKNPNIVINGYSEIKDCLQNERSYTVEEAGNINTRLLDYQIHSYREPADLPPLWSASFESVYDLGITPVSVKLYHNTQFYTWSLPMGNLDVARCIINTKTNYNYQMTYQPQANTNQNGTSYSDLLINNLLNFVVVFSLIYVSCLWMVQVIVDRVTKSKHLQMVGGVNPWLYWVSNVFMDFVFFIPGAGLLCLVAYAFGTPLVKDGDSFGVFFVGLVFFGFTDIVRTYCFARFFKSTLGGIGFNLIYFGLFSVVASLLPTLVTQPGVKEAIILLDFFPSFLLQIHADDITATKNACPFDKSVDPELFDLYCDSVWSMDLVLDAEKGRYGFGYYLLRYITNLIIWVAILFFIDWKDMHPHKLNLKLRRELKVRNPDDMPIEDEKVYLERKRVISKYGDVKRDKYGSSYATGLKGDNELSVINPGVSRAATHRQSTSSDSYYDSSDDEHDSRRSYQVPPVDPAQDGFEDNDVLVLRGLRKTFPGKMGCCCGLGPKCAKSCAKKGHKPRACGSSPEKVAVDDLTFTVRKGECFGFLGVNGAGKTTTVSMLIGEIASTGGNAHFNGKSIYAGPSELYPNIGFCPQFDGLIPLLTGREILEFYAKVAKMDHSVVPAFVNEVINLIGVNEYADRLIQTYSGGNKRKLSLALAFIGDTKVVFLDEPSSGVDPASQRRLWSVISETTKFSDRCVILTTHSMLESEALCDRLCIMKEGRMLCLGSSAELKQQYGKGYMVECYIDENIEEALSKLERTIEGIHIEEVLMNRVRFSVDKRSSRISQLMRFLNEGSHEYGIRDFTVSELTLEALFVNMNQDNL